MQKNQKESDNLDEINPTSGMRLLISDLGIINLIGGIICNLANDLRYRSGIVYVFCPSCERKLEIIDFEKKTCLQCGEPVCEYNTAAEEFLESEWFDTIVSSYRLDTKRVKWLIRNKKITARKSHE
jgi:hypothetical protein